MDANFDYQKILDNWSVDDEQSKADFLDALYEFYVPGNGCYTGLFQRFQRDLTEFAANGRLERHFEQLGRNHLLEFGGQHSPA